jgi:hypothetical protein
MNYLGRKNDLLLRNGLNLRHLLAKSPSSYEEAWRAVRSGKNCVGFVLLVLRQHLASALFEVRFFMKLSMS